MTPYATMERARPEPLYFRGAIGDNLGFGAAAAACVVLSLDPFGLIAALGSMFVAITADALAKESCKTLSLPQVKGGVILTECGSATAVVLSLIGSVSLLSLVMGEVASSGLCAIAMKVGAVYLCIKFVLFPLIDLVLGQF